MDLNRQKKEFLKALEHVDAKKICGGEYSCAYLQHLLTHKEYYTAIYVRVLAELTEKFLDRQNALCIVDYGCGNGLLGLFALQCGFSKVIFQDSDPEFLDAAKKLSNFLDFKNAHFVPGEIDKLSNLSEKVDAIVGTDVIEHIYDLDDFFEKAKMLNEKIVTVFTTAANPFNPVSVRRLKKLQVRDEHFGSDGHATNLSGSPHPSYLEMRRKYILENFPGVENVKVLARTTRGLAGNDIGRAVKKYQLTNRLPVPVHPTNTCHPLTGSWTERLLTGSQYTALYNKHGFRLQIGAGFYNPYKKGVAALAFVFLNVMVFLLGKTFSPFIILTGSKK